jgi:hypothetical protein
MPAELKDAIIAAKKMVNHVVTRLKAHDALEEYVNELAFFYFKTDKTGPSKGEFDTIKDVLVKVQSGLQMEAITTIKTFTNATRIDKGYVNPHGTWRPKKQQWIPGVLSNDQVTPVYRGAIHLNERELQGMTFNPSKLSRYNVYGRHRAARTLIHEASHKWASTADFGERGYVSEETWDFREGGQDEKDPLKVSISKPEALRNADSYAWFVFMVCDSTGMKVKAW